MIPYTEMIIIIIITPPPLLQYHCSTVEYILTLSRLSVVQRIFPFVLAMVGNGSISYDHERDGRPTELGGCNAMVRNLKHDSFLFIRYVRRRLTVIIYFDHSSW